MLKKLALLALSTAVCSQPVQANAVKDYIYSNPVLEIIDATGTTILFKGEDCKDAYGLYNLTTDTMTICLENHETFAELGDTIRHEAIHVVQACNRGPVLSVMDTMKYVTEQDKAFVADYPHAHQHSELEANIAARNLSDKQVTEVVAKFCFE
jgi:hypothetical protein